MLRTKLTLSTLATVMLVAGCSTQMVQPTAQKDVSATKVEAVKVNPELDLGDKNGSSVTVNLNFPKKESPFGIKGYNFGFNSSFFLSDSNSKLVIQVRKYSSVPNENPGSRFDSTTNTLGTTTSLTLTAPFASTFKLVGLQAGNDFYISARAYTNFQTLDTEGYNVNIATDGTVTSSGLTLNDLKLEKTDILKVNGVEYIITNISPNITVVPAPAVAITGTTLSVSRNVVGQGSFGGTNGQASSDTATTGGGTAGGFADPLADASTPDKEEFVRITNDGYATIKNDNNPSNLGTPNNILDLVVRLRKDIKAQVNGSITVKPGSTDGTNEEIVTP